MKKIKVILVALVFTLGVGGAIANSSTKHALKDPTFNWQTANADGTVLSTGSGGVYEPNKTVSDAESLYGCSGAAADCAVQVNHSNGTPIPGAQYIKHN